MSKLMDYLGGGLLEVRSSFQGAYIQGGAGPQVISLNSTQGGLILRDNATPLGTTLFGVQDSAGASKWIDVTAGAVQIGGTMGSPPRVYVRGSADNNAYMRIDSGDGNHGVIYGAANTGANCFGGTITSSPFEFRTNNTARLIFSAAGAIGFFGSAGTTKPTVSGSKGANAALTSLMTALSGLGLVTDTTT